MEADAFLRQREILQCTSPINRHKGKIFAVSAVLFLSIVTWLFGWVISSVLFVVVLFHELGHLLAMRAFGYSNTSILFLPGLGALTAGEKENSSPYQRLIVYLAGPVPGILLSGILLYAAIYYLKLPTQPGLTAALFQSGWLSAFAIASLFFNYFNLLPVFPLDGGRVVGMLAFSRLPRGSFVFTLAGCMIFMSAALALRDTVALALGLFLAIGIPGQWDLTRVRLAMGKREREALTEDEAAKMVFEALSQPRFAKWPLNRRFAMTDILITECMERPPRVMEVLIGGCVYLLCLALPFLYSAHLLNVLELCFTVAQKKC